MKKLIITGLTVLLISSLIMIAACDFANGINEVAGPQYTNFELSADGKTGTLYLDGTMFPVNASQRALTSNLAKKGHDFFEVVFTHTSGTTRASWELGEAAGISNVPRGAANVGINYATGNAAILFVGRKADKTLLAVGLLASADGTKTTADSPGNIFVVPDTTKVTFAIQPITAGLPAAGTAAAAGQTFLTAASAATITGAPTVLDTQIAAANVTVGSGYSFQAYKLTPHATNTHVATYTLGGIGTTHTAGIMLGASNDAAAPFTYGKVHIATPPRFPLGGGNYGGLGTPWATATEATIQAAGGVTLTANSAIPLGIPFVIAPGLVEGVCSLTFQLPVYAITNATVTGVPASIDWFIRPGFGTSVYDLDDGPTAGKSGGGAILLAVGTVNLNYITVTPVFP